MSDVTTEVLELKGAVGVDITQSINTLVQGTTCHPQEAWSSNPIIACYPCFLKTHKYMSGQRQF